MASNLDKYKEDLKKLIALGDLMSLDLYIRSMEEKGDLNEKHLELKKKVDKAFDKKYQRWYTESCALIRQLVPDRIAEFEILYKGEDRRKGINLMTYTLQDWFMGVRATENIYTGEKAFNDFVAASMRFNTQFQILKSIEGRFLSSLFDIKQLVQADLFDSELDTCRELSKNGYLRAAGVVAGVVLESHLSQVCANHGATTRKKNPTISDFNDLLKKNTVIDVPQWRFIQRLGDLRNLCGHKKAKEPDATEVQELIDGVEKITKTLY